MAQPQKVVPIEIQETISEAEQKFEHWRGMVGLFLGPLIAVGVYFLPMPSLTPKAHMLATILCLVVTWWITEPVPIPMTSLIGPMLCVLFGVETAAKTFAPFAEPIIFLFLGSFILAEAMAIHGLDKRVAFGIMSMRFVGNSSGRILLAFGVITGGLSMWISNTAACAMMYPIGLGICTALASLMEKNTGRRVDPTKLRFGTGMMLMAAYAASVGGIGTPVGTPPNLIGIGMLEKLAKVKIPFFQWMLLACPIMVVMMFVLWFMLKRLHKPEMDTIEGTAEFVAIERAKLGRWTAGQKNALFAFIVTVTLWVIPGFLAVMYGTSHEISKSYNRYVPEAVACLLGAGLLFLLPTNFAKREFTITWKQATKIDWGTLMLFGGGLALGQLMFDTKLAEAMGKGILNMSGANSLWGITFLAIAMSVAITEVTSNTAAANMVVPVVISLALAAHVSPVPPAIGAALGASLAFMLPVSTPPNAVVYGSGMVPITKMISTGIYFDVASVIVLFAGLRILLPMLGLAG